MEEDGVRCAPEVLKIIGVDVRKLFFIIFIFFKMTFLSLIPSNFKEKLDERSKMGLIQ